MLNTANEHPRKTVIVTGATGFIGGAIASESDRRGCRVVQWSRRSSNGVHAVDFGDPRALAAELADLRPSALYHCVGSADVQAAATRPMVDLESVMKPLGSTLEAVRMTSLSTRFVLVSSAAVYGQPDNLPITESTPLRPMSAYGFHRVQAETLGREYAECHGLDISVNRVFSTFGPNQRRLLIWELAEQLIAGAPNVKLQGTGDEVRDYLPASQLAETICDLAGALPAEPGKFAEYNIASGRTTTTRHLAEKILRLAKRRGRVICHGTPKPGHPSEWAVDVTKIGKFTRAFESDQLDMALRSCLEHWGVVPKIDGCS